MRKAKHHFYTLTELLVVVAIAAILLGITLPAFTTLIKGNAMTSATNELAAKIKATRAYAITNNCYTALVFPSSGFDNKKHFRHRSYRPCIVNKLPDSNTFEFESWIEEENWTLIPPGIVIATANEANPAVIFKALTGTAVPVQSSDISSGNTADPAHPIKIPAEQVDLAGVSTEETIANVMIFRPDGQLQESIVLALQEGAVVEGSVVDSQATGQRVYYPIFINKRSGKISYFEPLSK